MNNRFLLWLLISLLTFTGGSVIASANTDSLKRAFEREKDDSMRVVILRKLAWDISYENLDSGIYYGNKAMFMARNMGSDKLIANVQVLMGTIYTDKGQLIEAAQAYYEAEKIYKKTNDLEGLGYVYANISNLENVRGNLDKMLFYLKEALFIFQKLGKSKSVAGVCNNLASYYANDVNLDSAFYYLNISHQLIEEENIDIYRGTNYSMYGDLYGKKGDIALSDHYFALAKKEFEKTTNRYDLVSILSLQATYAIEMKNWSKALPLLTEAIEGGKEAGMLDKLRRLYKERAIVNEELGNYKAGLEDFQNYSRINDSLNNLEAKTKLQELNLQMETEKKNLELQQLKSKSELDDIAREHQAERISKQNILLGASILFLLVVAVLAIVLFRSNRAKQKTNQQLQSQKEIIEEKNKEIVDSISYARRLQQAILPPVKSFNVLGEHFLIYKPKDIVAGDFYWLESFAPNGASDSEGIYNRKWEDRASDSEGIQGKILFAVCDCTGHGVPGAMVSVVCHNALHSVVTELGITEPGKILDKVRELVVETFAKSGEEVRDGMDVSICCYHPATRELEWAGANNPLWINPASDKGKIIEYKANKQPIGKVDHAHAFTTHKIMLQKGDTIYLFSDGYSDQFGGEKGKKLKSANFQQLILQHSSSDLRSQSKVLSDSFEKWKGNFEQVDDVCIIGVRI